MILTVTLNPSVDRTVFLPRLEVGDTNRVTRTEIDAGGKGINLSRIVQALGGSTLATGFLGGGVGEVIRGRLDEVGLPHDFVQVTEPTRVNVSIEVTEAEQPPTSLNEPGPNISEHELRELRQRLRAVTEIHEPGWVCLCGSAPRGVPKSTYAALCAFCKEAGWRVVIDADGDLMREGLTSLPNLVKPNQPEASRLLGKPIDSAEEALAAVRSLHARLDPSAIAIISRGAEGAVLATAAGTWLGHSPQVEARSTIGSGDSMIGGILWALEAGLPIPDAFRWGLAAGAATAVSDGSDIGHRAVIELLFAQAQVESV